LIKDFKSFVSEALILKREGGDHYLERVKTRLANLKITEFTDSTGKRVSVPEEDRLAIQAFYRKALSSIADPEQSRIFSELDIKPGHIGIIRLGKPKVTLASGEIVEPIFKVYERTDKLTGEPVLRSGKCFWLFTIGSQVSTIKLYNFDGNSVSEKQKLIDKSIDHLMSDREAELAKISRVFSVKLDSKEDLVKRHEIVVTPAGISIIGLNLASEKSINDQLEDFLRDSTRIREERVMMVPRQDAEFTLESIPKQMNITPDKVWLLEKNATHNTWGALPILQVKQINGLTGNEIQVKVGKKWLHWLNNPSFNTPIQIDRVIKKGDTITLGKRLGSGDWLINTGVITDIATDARSSEFPYVKTNGWTSSDIISKEQGEVIFKDYRETNESEYSLLDFKSFINL
jgi:hypothetical protein